MAITNIKQATIRMAQRKFEVGDPLSDQELKVLTEFYEYMEWGLGVLGNDYNLARRPVQRSWDTLLSYIQQK